MSCIHEWRFQVQESTETNADNTQILLSIIFLYTQKNSHKINELYLTTWFSGDLLSCANVCSVLACISAWNHHLQHKDEMHPLGQVEWSCRNKIYILRYVIWRRCFKVLEHKTAKFDNPRYIATVLQKSWAWFVDSKGQLILPNRPPWKLELFITETVVNCEDRLTNTN